MSDGVDNIDLEVGRRWTKGTSRKDTIMKAAVLVFGILSLFSFVLYFYSANHAPYTYIDVIFWGPLCSFIGIVISIITRKTRKIHPALWISGIISCMLGFIVCMFVFSMLMNHRSEESQVHSKIECLSKKWTSNTILSARGI